MGSLGYCTACNRLKAITTVGLRLGSRECEWAPVKHDAPETHFKCGGYIERIEEENGKTVIVCATCVRKNPTSTLTETDVIPGIGLCRGSRKPIR